ncbi:MAG: prepilin-type N-terminal cleavage/methylation domain-containing protein [Phycisphaerae bacterium]
MQKHSTTAFTLVEILIVVIILGILAAIVIPQFASASDDAANSAFVSDLRTFTKAAYLFMGETGELLEDSGSGHVPAGWGSYIDTDAWLAGPNIGGVWDVEQKDTGGVTSALGVHFNGTGATRDDPFMLGIDQIVDNGDLAGGHFRKLAAARYYSVLRP